LGDCLADQLSQLPIFVVAGGIIFSDERRRARAFLELVEGDGFRSLATAQQIERGFNGSPAKVGFGILGRVGRFLTPRHAQKNRLQTVLSVGRTTSDAIRRAKNAVVMTLKKTLEPLGIRGYRVLFGINCRPASFCVIRGITQ